MADKSVEFLAGDLFGLHANFKEQESSTRVTREFSIVKDAYGDKSCETAASNIRTDVTNRYEYCGATIVSDAGTFLSTFGFSGSYAVDSAEFTFSAGQKPGLSVSGHNHADNAHADVWPSGHSLDASGVIAASQGGDGIPALTASTHVITEANDSIVTDMSITLAIEHVDVNGASNEHWAGTSRNCRVDLRISGVGVASDISLGTSWVQDDVADNDSNETADTFEITAHLYIARAVA